MAVFGCCKTFSGKYIFSGNANFRKRKMFPCVWLHFKKFSGKYFLVFGKEEGKHKSENTSHNPEKKKSSTTKMFPVRRPRCDRDPRSRSMARSRSRLLREIAIDSARLRRRDRDRQRDRAVDRDLGLELELAISDWIFSSLARSLSFSGNALKGK